MHTYGRTVRALLHNIANGRSWHGSEVLTYGKHRDGSYTAAAKCTSSFIQGDSSAIVGSGKHSHLQLSCESKCLYPSAQPSIATRFISYHQSVGRSPLRTNRTEA